ncbi:hypothetical protein ACFQH6_14045 [Halobacteriaceae archaeon GCM10025711]
MLNLLLDDFMAEFKDGTLKHVGPTSQSATAKLYDVTDLEVREFGDERVKLAFEDDEGNVVHVALFPDQARKLVDGIESLEDDSRVFE